MVDHLWAGNNPHHESQCKGELPSVLLAEVRNGSSDHVLVAFFAFANQWILRSQPVYGCGHEHGIPHYVLRRALSLVTILVIKGGLW